MHTPVSRSAFWILGALASGRRHGYGLIEEVRRASEGEVTLKVATLYATLDRLERDGLIARDGEEAVDGRLRRYFDLTDAGRAALAVELDRLDALSRYARATLARWRPVSS